MRCRYLYFVSPTVRHDSWPMSRLHNPECKNDEREKLRRVFTFCLFDSTSSEHSQNLLVVKHAFIEINGV